MLLPAWQAVRRSLSAHDRLVLAWPVARTARQWLGWLGGLGLDPPLVLGLYDGQGAPLDLPDALVHTVHPGRPVPVDDESLFERYESTMRTLPEVLGTALDHFDPEGTARVIVPCAAELSLVGGRAVLGGTPPCRRLLEDKIRVDALWDAIGVPRLPSEVVPLTDAEAVHQRMHAGDGTVWAGDNHSGIEAGAVATRHVFDETSLRAAVDLLAGRCRQVRIQPFIHGTPCSIQGIVLTDGTARTRPCEMLVLRDPTTGAFKLAGVSNTWDPPAPVADALDRMARLTGDHLRRAHGWRGGFSIDAIATEDGQVWPTELNARMTAGLALVDGTLPGPSLELVERVLREGEDIGVDANRLEGWIRSSTRRRRFCHARLNGLATPDEDSVLEHILGNHSATVSWTRASATGRLDIAFDPLRTPPGTRLGPRLAEALRIARAHWSLELPDYAAG